MGFLVSISYFTFYALFTLGGLGPTRFRRSIFEREGFEMYITVSGMDWHVPVGNLLGPRTDNASTEGCAMHPPRELVFHHEWWASALRSLPHSRIRVSVCD